MTKRVLEHRRPELLPFGMMTRLFSASVFPLQQAVVSTAPNTLQVAAEVSTVVIGVISVMLLVVILLFLVQLRKLLRSLQQHVQPVTDRARVAAENVEYITAQVRQDVQKVRASVSGLSIVSESPPSEWKSAWKSSTHSWTWFRMRPSRFCSIQLPSYEAFGPVLRPSVGVWPEPAPGETHKSRSPSRGRTTPKPRMRWMRQWPGRRPKEREDRRRPLGSFGLDSPAPGVALGVGTRDTYRSGRGCAGFALPAPTGRSCHH